MKKIIIFFMFLLFLGCKKGHFKENLNVGNGVSNSINGVSNKYLSTTDFLVPFSSFKNKIKNKNNETKVKRGIIIPVYFYDKTLWDKVIYADIDEILIINPFNGPGDNIDSNYEEFISKLVLNSKKPIGYVYTKWGNRPIEEVKDDIDRWLVFYPDIKGFFLDEAASGNDKINYYIEIKNYIKSKGDYFIVLNPGVTPDKSYFDIADNIVVLENNISAVNDINCSYSDKSSVIVYGAQESQMEEIVKKYDCKYVYVTDDSLPNPYDTLPNYFGEEINALK